MQPFRRHSFQSFLSSTVVHIVAVVVLVMALRHVRGALVPLRMPGTPQGTHTMLTYSLGGPSDLKPSAILRSAVRQTPSVKALTASPKAAPLPSAAAPSEKGTGSSGSSAFGDEDVHVALPQVHPRPQPDLSVLPHGTSGDVVVDVVIDEAGKVTGTTLVKGLGPSIDGSVVAALRGWTFSPATRNGQNVASEQEILIHYERG